MPKPRARHGWRSRILKAPENLPGERVECALRIAGRARDAEELRAWLQMLGLTAYEAAPEHGFVPGGRVSEKDPTAAGRQGKAASAAAITQAHLIAQAVHLLAVLMGVSPERYQNVPTCVVGDVMARAQRREGAA